MKLKTLHYLFLGLLLIAVIFEITYFLKLKPFSYPLIINYTPDSYIQDLLLERKLSKISLEEKVGALFIIGFQGTELTNETKKFIQDNYFRNFLLLGRNIQNQKQLTSLTGELCQLRVLTSTITGEGDDVKTRSLHTLIAIDQEGGKVSRIKFENMDQTSESMDQTPQSEVLNADQAYQIAQNRGEILANLNINMNFAPVVEIIRDENSYLAQDQRAFIGDHQRVFQLSQAMIKGYNHKGIISVLKHFPGGLGRQSNDPHKSLPVLNISKQELDKDLLPFKKLIQTENPKAIMTTHILYPQIDSDNPVTTSEKFISSILRGELGFKGVIITDDLIMKGVSAQNTVEQISKKAFLAGHDLILISGPPQVQVQARNAIIGAVLSGEISQKRLNTSLKRIMKISNF